MYAVTGITGQVGGVTGRALLNTGLSVRAVVRDAAKGAAWKKRGCEVALADMNDAPALTAAFTGTSGVFVLIPPNFDPEPGFPEVRAIINRPGVGNQRSQGRRRSSFSPPSARRRRSRTCSTSSAWWSRRWAPWQCRSASCGLPGLWKIQPGTSNRRVIGA